MLFSKRVISVFLLLILTAGLLVGCLATDYSQGRSVVEASVIKSLVGDPSVIFVDAREAEVYAKGHLKGAVSIPHTLISVDEPVPGLLAPKAVVEAVLSEKGIGNDTKVYIYDNKGGIYASRVWWVLKIYGHESVYVINDGEDALVKNGFEISAEVPQHPKTTYVAKEANLSFYASKADVLAAIDGTAPAKIVDVRSKAEFDEGAIPGAILYPHTQNLFEDGTFRPTAHIALNYKDLGLKKEEAIILYCKTSVRATQTLILLKEAGYTNVRVYDGAWVEWSATETPVDQPVQELAPTELDAS